VSYTTSYLLRCYIHTAPECCLDAAARPLHAWCCRVMCEYLLVTVLIGFRCDVVSCELARRGPTAYSIICRRDDNRGRRDLDRSDRNRISYVYRLSASLPTNVDSPRDPAARPCTSLPPAAQLTDTRARPSDNAHVMPGPACTGRGRRAINASASRNLAFAPPRQTSFPSLQG